MSNYMTMDDGWRIEVLAGVAKPNVPFVPPAVLSKGNASSPLRVARMNGMIEEPDGRLIEVPAAVLRRAELFHRAFCD